MFRFLILFSTILFVRHTCAQDNDGNNTYPDDDISIVTEPVPEPSIPVYRITTIQSPPWVFLKKVDVDGKNEVIYDGFAIDILKELAKRLNFRYEIHQVKDGRYVSYNEKDGQWVGMIGELLDSEADIAVGDLIITSEREEVVNFTKPLISSGSRIVMRKPKEIMVNVMFLLYPFKIAVWLLLVVVSTVVALIFYLINRFSPYEWSNVPAEKDVRRAKYSFNIRNSFLFVISCITLQGYREAPKSYSGRILAAIWWCFCIIINFAYVASLVAILMVQGPEKPTLPFKNINQMSMQSDIVYGAMENSRVVTYFRNSDVPMHKEMLSFMTNKGTLFSSLVEAESHIQNGGAAVVDNAYWKYKTGQDCDIMQIGGSLLYNSHAFAMRPGLNIAYQLNTAILELSDSGTLMLLEKKWWKRSCPDVDENAYDSESYQKGVGSHALKIAHVSFAFILLLVGVLLAVVVLLLENLYHRMNGKKSWTLRKQKNQTPEETPLDKTADETFSDEKTDKDDDAPMAKEEP